MRLKLKVRMVFRSAAQWRLEKVAKRKGTNIRMRSTTSVQKTSHLKLVESVNQHWKVTMTLINFWVLALKRIWLEQSREQRGRQGQEDDLEMETALKKLAKIFNR